jgi:hypothetical protein
MPPPEAGAIASARSCLEQDGYVMKSMGETWIFVSSQDGSETARIDASTNIDGDPYLTVALGGDAASVLHPSALRDAVHECLASWQAMPPSSEGNLP